MMKTLLLLLTISIISPSVHTQNDLLADVRSKIAQAFQDETVCNTLYDKFQKADVSGSAILSGYKASLEIAMSKHLLNPFKKMSYFNSGKDELEKAITRDASNIELRFLRFQIQYNTPAFLGYKDNLKNDKEFISKNLNTLENEELRNKISSFLSKAKL